MKSNRRVNGVVAFLATAALILAACGTSGGGDGGQPLRLADHFPPTNPHSSSGSVAFIDELGGAGSDVEINYLGAEQVAGADGMLDAVRDGTADISAVVMSYVSSELPETDVAQLPGSFSTAGQGTAAFWKLVDGELKEDFLELGVRPLFAGCLPQYQVATSDQKIDTMDDLQGLSLRSSGGAMSLSLEALGAVPVELPATEMYVGMERGTIDGTVAPLSSLPSYKIEEVAKHLTTNLALGSTCTVWLINEDVWSSLDEDAQAQLRDAGEATVDSLGSGFEKANDDAAGTLADGGMELYEMGEAAQVAQVLDGVADEWAATQDERGNRGTEILNIWRDLVTQSN